MKVGDKVRYIGEGTGCIATCTEGVVTNISKYCGKKLVQARLTRMGSGSDTCYQPGSLVRFLMKEWQIIPYAPEELHKKIIKATRLIARYRLCLKRQCAKEEFDRDVKKILRSLDTKVKEGV